MRTNRPFLLVEGGWLYAPRCETLDSSRSASFGESRRVVGMTEVYTLDLTAAAPDWPEGKRWQWREQMMYQFPQGWARTRASAADLDAASGLARTREPL